MGVYNVFVCVCVCMCLCVCVPMSQPFLYGCMQCAYVCVCVCVCLCMHVSCVCGYGCPQVPTFSVWVYTLYLCVCACACMCGVYVWVHVCTRTSDYAVCSPFIPAHVYMYSGLRLVRIHRGPEKGFVLTGKRIKR